MIITFIMIRKDYFGYKKRHNKKKFGHLIIFDKIRH